ncbi:hypothetical protein CCZ01_07935 [Helicobacter monodelphidis]|uniref:hypothetical protein n=1 Tax=Helicobacter sp. 15-1451 TaxID=2004995 RepID=UPI000DCE2339|nr:hypothetical protein [Helicobacter sp. 15-1451]RAX56974.1 hypothetical protein CCZ01_07935 [Helicobacter sp. 15-1451]
MATFMEKDVLLEYAHIGHLTMNLEYTTEIEQDLRNMHLLWDEIIMTNPEDIDYQAMLERIRAIRVKYEQQ